jgi:hypothetical protein
MFWPSDLKTWTEVVLNIITIIVALIAGLWAYTRLVIERGSFPGTQFNIELGTTGIQKDRNVVEFLVHLKNIGKSALIVKNIRFDIRYLNDDQDAKIFDSNTALQGKLHFPNSLRSDIEQGRVSLHTSESNQSVTARKTDIEHTMEKNMRGFLLVEHNTFVLPNVDQTYTFTTSVPNNTTYVLAYSSFEYEIKLTRINAIVIRLSRFLGIIQYSLTHIDQPHTCERVFKFIK